MAGNALIHERDTADSGLILKLPLDVFENFKSHVIVIGLLVLCPLSCLVNHLAYRIAQRSKSSSWQARVASISELTPQREASDLAIYSIVFLCCYHLFPCAVIFHLLVRLFREVPAETLWDFTASAAIDGNHARVEGLSYLAFWMTPLLLLLVLAAFTTLSRTLYAIYRKG